jgi:hypothetical protein
MKEFASNADPVSAAGMVSGRGRMRKNERRMKSVAIDVIFTLVVLLFHLC